MPSDREQTGGPIRRLFSNGAEVLRAQIPFAKRHRKSFVAGSLAAALVVAIRLSLPQVFHKMLEPWLSGSDSIAEDPSYWTFVAIFGGVVAALFVALGYADHLERLKYARFAIGTVRDLRRAAGRAALVRGRNKASGDLVARLVGDTARMKAGIKGFLVHVATNGLLLVGATIILLAVNLTLGLLLVIADIAILAVTCYGAAVVFDLALKNRSREGKMALSLERKLAGERGMMRAFDKNNERSGGFEGSVTKAVGRTTWAAHAIYGVAVVASLGIGASAIPSGRVSVSDLVMFLLYALILRPPIVQLTRQGTRTGKILACGVRIDEVLRSGKAVAETPPLAVLKKSIKLKGIRILASKSRVRRARLGPLNLSIPAGRHIMICGPPGSGKTTLLKVISGEIIPKEGRYFWNQRSVIPRRRFLLAQHVHYCEGASAQWPRQRIGKWLGIPQREPTKDVIDVLKLCGALKIIRRLNSGLETKIASKEFSSGERAALSLAKAVLCTQSVILLDESIVDVFKRKKKEHLERILSHRSDATIVYATRTMTAPELFAKVYTMDRGKLKTYRQADHVSIPMAIDT